jgi:hypothetical protein
MTILVIIDGKVYRAKPSGVWPIKVQLSYCHFKGPVQYDIPEEAVLSASYHSGESLAAIISACFDEVEGETVFESEDRDNVYFNVKYTLARLEGKE